MNCKFCNAELKEDASFCHECGAKVEDNTKEDAPKFCKCGAELTPDIKFCAQCGAAVAENGIEKALDADKRLCEIEKAAAAEKVRAAQAKEGGFDWDSPLPADAVTLRLRAD